jgi:hypothetical protein
MSEITPGVTFLDGQAVNASILNALLGSASIKTPFYTNKATITPVAADKILFLDISGSVFGITTIAALITAMQGATSATLAAGNDTRFPATLNGIRLANGANADTAAKPKDFVLAPTAGVPSAGAVTLNCANNNLFTVAFVANTTVTLSNVTDGDLICIQITQDGTGSRLLTLATTQTLWYEGNSAYVLSTAAASVDFLFFKRVGNNLLTWIRKDFGP